MMRKTLVAASRERLRRLQRCLRRKRLAAYLATAQAEVTYLSNFRGEDSYLVVPARGRATLVTDFRYAQDAAAECPHLRRVLRRDSLVAEAVRSLRRRRRPLGFNPAVLPVSVRRQLSRLLGAGGLRQLPEVVSRMRAVKDAAEVAAIERALRIAERAYADFLKRLRPGMTESRLVAELEYALRCHGSEGSAFATICAVGPSAARPHARPGARRLTAAAPLLVDFGAVADGYRCDLTRMIFLARIRPEVERAYRAVLEAQAAAIAAAGPGARAVDVDAAARSVLERCGYGKAFGHGTGHGLGLETHEAPSVSPKAGALALRPGMIITIEPGIYLPGKFGIRIEDDVLITGKGRRVLSRLRKQVDEVRLPARR